MMRMMTTMMMVMMMMVMIMMMMMMLLYRSKDHQGHNNFIRFPYFDLGYLIDEGNTNLCMSLDSGKVAFHDNFHLTT